MSLEQERAMAFVENYGKTWDGWDIAGFVELFSDEVVYVDHPTEKTVVGRDALASYLRKEESEQGAVSVRMGKPIVERNHVVAEFWTTRTNGHEEATLTGCFIAQLNPTDGRCTHFREYWFDTEGHTGSYQGWGE